MPTGYTAKVYEGTEESIKTFLAHAARGLGAYIHQRDEGSDVDPDVREYNKYSFASVTQAADRLHQLHLLSKSDRVMRYYRAKNESDRVMQEMETNRAELAARFDEFIDALDEVDFPVDDPVAGEFFKGLKSFAEQQLTDSKRYDASEYPTKSFDELYPTPEEWYNAELLRAAKSVAYSADHLVDEIERVQKQNAIHARFVEFLDSLDKPKSPPPASYPLGL